MVIGYNRDAKANYNVALLLVTLIMFSLKSTKAQIGVTYGSDGNNLPSPQDVVNIYKSNGIGRMRLYYPDPAKLQAAQGSGIKIFLDVPNDQVQNFAQNPQQAVQWVQQNVAPFASSINYLAVGNEVPQEVRQFVGPAMTNVLNSLNSFNSLADQIKVTTTIGMSEIKNAYPPSAGEFADLPFMDPIVNFLEQNGSPLMLNVYPYFTYVQSQGQVSQDYALFTSPGPVTTDPNNGRQYQNVYDALVDSAHAALAKRGAGNVPIVTSETGWPNSGGDSAGPGLAGTYYRGVAHHAKYGTPLKPGPTEVYLFAMFDENQKPGDAVEQHFGIFNTDGTPKYDGINFNP
ncbi:hypothetical protein RND81_12G179200 [Saponaria officinalis]|uniref:Uncharacterized protein n=1 Tax=Saponaria officinalis TaxID=3572 RepID=A0AAW1HC27_SAPOF